MITVVIPVGFGRNYEITLDSLIRQTWQDFEVVPVHGKPGENANVLRNRGFQQVNTPYVLFSDDDINWERNALETMIKMLERNTEASYCYGYYEFEEDGYRQCNVEFDADRLRKLNYISTMSLIKTKDFPGFDESITRLQDWSLWLTMLEQGKTGVYCGKRVFTTKRGEGITFGGKGLTWQEAVDVIKLKHELE